MVGCWFWEPAFQRFLPILSWSMSVMDEIQGFLYHETVAWRQISAVLIQQRGGSKAFYFDSIKLIYRTFTVFWNTWPYKEMILLQERKPWRFSLPLWLRSRVLLSSGNKVCESLVSFLETTLIFKAAEPPWSRWIADFFIAIISGFCRNLGYLLS